MSTSQRDSVIFLDWDDTLLPSSWLTNQGLSLDSVESDIAPFREHLTLLETSVSKLIQTASSVARLHIITNAEAGWVDLSCKKFFPNLTSLLSKVDTLSARSTFEPHFPMEPVKWKFYAFEEKLVPVYKDTKQPMKNIVSMGDSNVEREAILAISKGLPQTLTKSIKFAIRPTAHQLHRQQELILSCFESIFIHEGDLDLQLTVGMNDEAPPADTSNDLTYETPLAHAPSNGRTELEMPWESEEDSDDSLFQDDPTGHSVAMDSPHREFLTVRA